jgi:16S rRNA (cytosine967-C5)-methyltransferase
MDTNKRKQASFRAAKTPRGLAVKILNRIEDTDAFAEPLLDVGLSGDALSLAQDRHLVTELVYGTLRMKGHLDWIIGQFQRPGRSSSLDTAVRNILRTALYQIIYTDRIPAFAAVDEAVKLAKKNRPAAAPLVNAILRNFLRRRESLPYPDPAVEPALYLSIVHSHPLWLVERWIAESGLEETGALCAANNRTPPLTARINTLKTDRDSATAILNADGTTADAAPFSPDGIVLGKSGTTLQSLSAVQDGLIRIQEEASHLIARLASPVPGEDVLDLCAGSGGKATHLAALMENRGRILAVDNSPAKLISLTDTATRMGITIVETLAADATEMQEDDVQERFDLVMADVPCSGLGTLRRNPEIKWRIRPEDLKESADLQGSLLRHGAAFVKIGGRLVYSTCSVMSEENEDVIKAFLSAHKEFALSGRESDPAVRDFIGPDGFFRTYPHRHNMDGFFGAVLTRIA